MIILANSLDYSLCIRLNCVIQPGAQSGVWKSASQAVPTSEFIILWDKTGKGRIFFITDLSFPQNAADKCLLSKMHLNVKSFEELQRPQSADNLASASESLGLRLLILWPLRITVCSLWPSIMMQRSGNRNNLTKDWGGLIGDAGQDGKAGVC